MPESFIDGAAVGVALGVGRLQLLQAIAPVSGHSVAVVRAVFAPHEDGKGQVAQRGGVGVVGVAGHHGRGGETIGHARGQLVHPVAARGVPQEVDAVGVNPFGRDERLDQAVEQIIDVALVPQVPRVGGGPGCDVDAFLEGVQLDLVAPLLVVDSRWRAAAAVHRDPQALLTVGGLAKVTPQVLEGVVAREKCLCFQFRCSFFGQRILALAHQPLGETLGLVLGEAHFIPHQIHQHFARRGGPA